jgi:inosine/xanthosine triphosphate pyrophosphatase family protein
MKVIFVTTNEHKRREVQEILGFELERADLDLPEIQAIDPAEVAAEKASAAREALGRPGLPVLVEDSGLMVDEWDGYRRPLLMPTFLRPSIGAHLTCHIA